MDGSTLRLEDDPARGCCGGADRALGPTTRTPITTRSEHKRIHHRLSPWTTHGTHTSFMRSGSKELTQLISNARGDAIIETDLTYDGLRPVIVRISNREGRCKVTDDGAAVSAAGDIGRHVAYPEQISLGRYSVNVSRQGVVWLPAVRPAYAWLERICDLVSTGSVVLYERLLDLDAARPQPQAVRRGR